MSENLEIDINQVVANLVQNNARDLLGSGKKLLDGFLNSFRLRLSSTYREYLLNVVERYSKTKTFLLRNEPVPLYDIYVPLSLKVGNLSSRTIVDVSIRGLVRHSKYSVIVGNAGGGKSMLMRHLLLDTIRNEKKIPVMLELREMNAFNGSLLELIQGKLKENKFDLDAGYVAAALRSGHFAFFLDGYDELNQSVQSDVGKQILDLASLYQENWFVVSSRPDQVFAGWKLFAVVQVSSLSVDKARLLVQKLPYIAEIKDKFLLNFDDLFNRHISFLSNPLLLSIMLLTYGTSGGIPAKISVFYENAYAALYDRHDAAKGGYTREKRSKLDIEDFARVFSVMSLLTYDKREVEFDSNRALEYLSLAKSFVPFDYVEEDVLYDLLSGVNLIIEDGLSLRYVHRSFQEYFTARFIVKSKESVQVDLVNRYTPYFLSDRVIHLLFEMSRNLIEKHFVLPRIETMISSLGIKSPSYRVTTRNYLKYLRTATKRFMLIDFTQPKKKSDGEMDWQIAVSSSDTRKTNEIFGVDLFAFAGFLRNSYPTIYSSIDTEKGKFKGSYPDCYQTDGSTFIDTKNLRQDHPLFHDLIAFGGLFSIKFVEAVVDLRTTIQEENSRLDTALEKILLPERL